MSKNTQIAAVRVGVDLSKRVIQVHAVGADGRVLTNRALSREKFLPWCAQLPTGCMVVMEVSSSAGKNQLGTITKRGDTYLRTLLIQGANSVVNTAHTRSDPISRWALALKERSGCQKAVVALANKNARILWAVMTRSQRFDPQHISIKPGNIAPA